MVFSSPIFLFGFFPLLILLYYAARPAWRNAIALVGSYLFYAWGEPVFCLILFVSTLFDFIIGNAIHRSESESRRKVLLVVALSVSFGLLGYYKYANFFVLDILGLLPATDSIQNNWSLVALPIGISFFTFQKASYLIDIYRRQVLPARSLQDFALYVSLFPQLIAGPIVRYHDINQQLASREYNTGKFLRGMTRFSKGLAKKVLIANSMAYVADTILAQPIDSLPMLYAWVAIMAYTLQIYFDFSGYSDMAIGLGMMMGFKFLENFNRPYTASTVTEFWRRWHISLSNWMKEYLFVPLGGSRASQGRIYLNLWIVFLISGLWHGASWTFIVWGAYHGFFLSLERSIGLKTLQRIPYPIGVVMTFLIVMIGWIFFRLPTISEALLFLRRLLAVDSIGEIYYALPVYEWLDSRFVVTTTVAIILSFNPFNRLPADREIVPVASMPSIPSMLLALILLALSFASLANSSYNPFIYFRF